MFERFSDSARRLVVLAQEQARVLGDPFIGSQHLLLGLAGTTERAAAALADVGFDADAARRELSGDEAGKRPAFGHIPFTRNAKRVLEHSVDQADKDGRRTIGTADLLLSLLDTTGSTGRRILDEQGVDVPELRHRLQDVAAEEAAAEPAKRRDDAGPRGSFVPRGGVIPIELVEALHRYGQHLDGCPGEPCTCGLGPLRLRYPLPPPASVTGDS